MFWVCFICQSGKLQIFELASGSLLEAVDAHDGAVWSLCLAPDQVNMTICLSVCLQSHPSFLTVSNHVIVRVQQLASHAFSFVVCVSFL